MYTQGSCFISCSSPFASTKIVLGVAAAKWSSASPAPPFVTLICNRTRAQLLCVWVLMHSGSSHCSGFNRASFLLHSVLMVQHPWSSLLCPLFASPPSDVQLNYWVINKLLKSFTWVWFLNFPPLTIRGHNGPIDDLLHTNPPKNETSTYQLNL